MTQLLYNKKNILNFKNTLDKKEFSIFYSKFFIRGIINNKMELLDNNFEVSSSVLTNNFKTIGSSIIIQKIVYSSKYYKDLKFTWFSPKMNIQQSPSSFTQDLNKINFIFFLGPVKGGLKCYASGFIGIMQKKQLNLLFVLIRKHFKNKKTFLTLVNYSKFLSLRFPVQIKNIRLYNLNLNKKKHIKKNTNLIRIFFCCKENLILYERKKINKKNRIYHFKKKNK